MSREDAQFKLRLPPDLKADVEAFAKANHRSMNAEIVAQMQTIYSVKRGLEAVDCPPGAAGLPETPAQRIERITERVRQYAKLIDAEMRELMALTATPKK